MKSNEAQFSSLIQSLTQIGIALSTEKNHSRLLELILMKALEITNADGGTLYTKTDNKTLKFEIMINKSLGIHMGGTSKTPIGFSELPLYDEHGDPNFHMLAPWSAINRQTINLKDAYTTRKFDLSGTKQFDKKTGYKSQSFLTVPMTNHLNEVIGVLQLINAIDPLTNKVSSFSKLNQTIVESLASQAAVTITNRALINAEKELFNSLIQLIAKAIDEKSPYTGQHCRRVPVITLLLAKAACEVDKGPLKEFTMTEDELYELEVSAWLHDCGKISIPESVVDKATKLEEIFDRIHLIDLRFELLIRDAMIECLQDKIQKLTGNPINLHEEQSLQEKIQAFYKERAMIRKCNLGKEHIHPEELAAIKNISKHNLVSSEGKVAPFLSKKEIQMLEINRGTLTVNEREIINNHVTVTIKMLESLPYPKHLKRVPELAGSHHEKMDGSGYPRGLTKEQMSIPARMIAIADVFEALTASDRPYKKAMTLSRALKIMGQMKVDGHIDPDLFDVFIEEKVYETYAKDYLNPKLVDTIQVNKIPGYQKLE
ncbi:HD domain-containing phosphohydrolase [Legionella waltersii]|uniref:Metal dependent phosphohydrolase n=1 Tax=Legionella waltersii TaxID=66969 RepID=A0A0W1A5B3_9GAMM|nr:HD domain-containing phosphohydrolase [Legionella waltersii]KTD76456.1 metal dependent phosphohydrolase [Legionella waltersii]SNV14553.1 metal dependent phosphohydrolase [Legionella waltersii]